ncbi:MAG: hypothetical protein ACI9P8_000232, partial [Bacteroidia bacterium]
SQPCFWTRTNGGGGPKIQILLFADFQLHNSFLNG